MKKLICSLGLLVSLPSLASTVSWDVINKKSPVASLQPSLYSYAPFTTGSSLMFGRGYDSFKDDTSGKCVIVKDSKYDPSRAADSIQESVFKFELIESRHDLAKKIGVTAAASLKSGFSKGSASVSYLNEQSVNSYSLYVLVSAEVLTPIERTIDEDLDPDYIDLATSNINAFRQKCGNEYVAAIQRGGLMYALLKLETADTHSYTQIKSSLRAKVGTFKAAVDLERSITEATSNKSLQIFVHQIGGEAKSYPTNIADLMERVKDFSIEVTRKPTPLRAITVPYEQLKSYPISATPWDTSVQEKVFEQLNQLKFRLTDHRDNINYILSNKSQFNSPNLPQLQASLNEIHRKMNDINEQTRKCLTNFQNCKYPENFDYIQIDLPERLEKANADNQCKVRINMACGAIYKVAQGPECGPRQFKLAEHPLCGVKTWKLASTDKCNPVTYKIGQGSVCGPTVYRMGTSKQYCGSEDAGSCLRRVVVPGLKPSPNGPSGGCISVAKSCRHPAFGVESVPSCRHPSFGAETFEQCRHESHGAETYNSCRLEAFGYEAYPACEHPTHDVIAVKQCKLLEYFDQESGIVKYKSCNE